MKRDIHLQPLSRQHHNALMAVLLLKKGVKKKADLLVMKNFILDLWETELKQHFTAEEKWLQPSSVTNGLKMYFEQMIKEHIEIQLLIQQFKDQHQSLALVELFYKMLEKHIRFEERIFFPAIEKVFTNIELEQIGIHLKDHNTKNCISFPVKFWE
jgi:iron-sulfur cluster repair protein YtfE (RIC family)